jgi:hypothetical protein
VGRYVSTTVVFNPAKRPSFALPTMYTWRSASSPTLVNLHAGELLLDRLPQLLELGLILAGDRGEEIVQRNLFRQPFPWEGRPI